MKFKGIFISILTVCLLAMMSCGGREACADGMDAAESLMESRPDSAMKILEGIDKKELKSGRGKARYALLMSMALDKNYVDTTTFDVLQPAIDYYLRKGNSDERLRTLYYQGRIYQNAGDYEKAMDAFIDGRDLMPEATDTLTMARLFTAQGVLFHKQYKYKQFVENCLLSASLFKKKKMPEYEYQSLIKALNGSMLIYDKTRSDSIYSLCRSLADSLGFGTGILNRQEIIYHCTFDSPDSLKTYLGDLNPVNITSDILLDISNAYATIGDGKKSWGYIECARSDSSINRSLKYLSIKAKVLESNNDFENALQAYKEYNSLQERVNQKLMSDDLLFAERRHEMEMSSMKSLREKDRIILLWAIIGFGLLMSLGFLYSRYRILKTKRMVAEMKAARIEDEKELLGKEKEAAELRSENLQLQIQRLEEERLELKDLLNRNELTDAMREVIRERLTMLHSKLSKDILDGGIESSEYGRWIQSIKKDSESFMQSNQTAFRVSHPGFIRHLEEHGLDNQEINFVCLYALGMLGKEVGEFTKIKGHYNISTAIRKKLGIEEYSGTLRSYVKKMLDQK